MKSFRNYTSFLLCANVSICFFLVLLILAPTHIAIYLSAIKPSYRINYRTQSILYLGLITNRNVRMRWSTRICASWMRCGCHTVFAKCNTDTECSIRTIHVLFPSMHQRNPPYFHRFPFHGRCTGVVRLYRGYQ